MSVISPYCDDGFVKSNDHLPHLLQTIYEPKFLDYGLSELSSVASQYVDEKATISQINNLALLTQGQSKSTMWHRYRAGRITSRFKRVLNTDPQNPSISLLNAICYPETTKFTTKATTWVASMSKMLLKCMKHK